MRSEKPLQDGCRSILQSKHPQMFKEKRSCFKAGFGNGGSHWNTRGRQSPLEAKKGKEMGSRLEPPEGTGPVCFHRDELHEGGTLSTVFAIVFLAPRTEC